MKNEVNRAFMAKKKTYEIPSVEMTQLAMSSIVMAGSPGTLQNSEQGTTNLGGGEPIVGG